MKRLEGRSWKLLDMGGEFVTVGNGGRREVLRDVGDVDVNVDVTVRC